MICTTCIFARAFVYVIRIDEFVTIVSFVQTLWTGFRRFFFPPQKNDGFRTCRIINPYGFGTDLEHTWNDDNHPKYFSNV